jgi:hypothetical protein
MISVITTVHPDIILTEQLVKSYGSSLNLYYENTVYVS